MTANTMIQTTTGKSPCSCSGAAAFQSGCGCGGQCGCGCAACQNQAFTRPQFFAGQLLTEDDLQSLGDYVVAKNRLHNRYLFGDGVVCGLTVTCTPCKNGHVTVNAGYALDCCGNDIVVSCPTDLDINQMVRQLMLALRKADCGDPCPETTVPGVAAPAAAAVDREPPKPPSHKRRYCLYVDYCEQSTDPVAPYASNAACGQSICEPTRVSEGYRFELRCPIERCCEPGVSERFWSCVGDRRAADRIVALHEFLRSYLPSLGEGLRKIRENAAPPLDNDFWNRMQERTQALRSTVAGFLERKVKDVDEATLAPILAGILHLAGEVASVFVHPHLRRMREQLEPDLLVRAEAELESACDALRIELIEHAFAAGLPRFRAIALFELTRELIAESKLNRDRLESGNEISSHLSKSLVFRLLSERVVYRHALAVEVAEALTLTRDWLVDRLEQPPGGKHCALLCQVNAAALPASGATTEAPDALANILVKAGAILVPAVPEVMRSCGCDALIPSCAPCEDSGVLLACLTVEDCKIIDICNLDRKFVITAPNLRYWFPEICRIGETLEHRCCPSCKREGDDTGEDVDRVHRSSEDYLHAARGVTPPAGHAISTLLESRGLFGAHEPVRRMPERPAEEPVRPDDGDAAAELRKQLESALAEIGVLKSEQAKLRERVSKIEIKKPAGGRP